MSHKYELHYFNGRGRAEALRLTFAAAGVEFTDKRIEFKDWPSQKTAAPQGMLPYLVIDGEAKVPQSLAILRYLAREFDLYGKSKLENTCVDVVIETAQEVFNKGVEAHFQSDEGKKKELLEDFQSKVVPKYFDLVEKAAYGKGGYLVGSSLTIADLYIYSLVDGFKLEEAVKKFAKLKASVALVAENQRIGKYLKGRPVTEM